jgi:hypothetical protein
MLKETYREQEHGMSPLLQHASTEELSMVKRDDATRMGETSSNIVDVAFIMSIEKSDLTLYRTHCLCYPFS